MSATRLVVACRMPGALLQSDRPVEALARLEALVEKGESLGGALTASTYDGIAMSWDEEALRSAIDFATSACHQRDLKAPTWAAGVAVGEMHAPASGSTSGTHVFPWGAPLALAWALARIAHPREVLLDISVPAVATRELLVNRGRVGRVGGVRVRGFRLDARQPWRTVASADVGRMVDPPFIGRKADLTRLMEAAGLIVLRADSGFGGSRMLTEVAAATKPSRSITLTPFAVIQEPFGALRRALAEVAATERITLPPEMHPELDRLLSAQGVTVENASLLIAHQLQRHAGDPPSSLLIDDATDIDVPSLEACSRAMATLGATLRVVARIDSMSQLPQVLARHPHGEAVTLGRLDPADAQDLAAACTGGALEAKARVQWARRGGNLPLGVVEAVAAGVAKGELLWSGDELAPLKRIGGDEIARPVGYWIAKRAEDLEPGARDVLTALAHLGGEATVDELRDVVGEVSPGVDVEVEMAVLARGRWVREPRRGTFTVPTRAHREAILELSRDRHTREWHSAVAKALEKATGTLRRAEAAQHAARCGQGEWAARLAYLASRTAAAVGLGEVAASLSAFAGVQDPLGSDALDLELEDDTSVDTDDLSKTREEPPPAEALAAAPFPLVSPSRKSGAPSAPPSLPAPPAPEPSPPPPSAAEASSNAPLSPPRGKAQALPPAMTHGAMLESLQELRETRWSELARKSLVEGADARTRSRGLLALGRAFAAEGRSEEALVHGIDALARAREANDPSGIRTCLLFIARMFERTERTPEAGRIREAASLGV